MKIISNEHIKFNNFIFEHVNIKPIFFNISFCIKCQKKKSLNTMTHESIEFVIIVFQSISIEIP